MTSRFHHEEIYRPKRQLGTNIVVCGAGAIGSNLVETLARQGFHSLSVIDFDRIETMNLGTQVWGDMDIGAVKTDALRNRIFRHVGIEITSIPKKLTEQNANKLLCNAELVVDGFDNSASRRLVQDVCRQRKISCLHAGLFEDYGEVVWDDIYQVPKDGVGDVCDYPLARNLIMLVVAIAGEEITYYCSDQPRWFSWSITLKDLAIRRRE